MTSILIEGILSVIVLGIAAILLKHRKPLEKDPQRLFSPEQVGHLTRAAGGRCEHKSPLGPRCSRKGDWADHVVPWSRGGRTELTNGQMLCREHRDSKAHKMPSRLYRWRLARRRWHY